MNVKRFLIILVAAGIILIALRNVYPVSLLTEAVTPLFTQASTAGQGVVTTLQENVLNIPLIGGLIGTAGLAVGKIVYSKFQSVKKSSVNEIMGLQGQASNLFSQKAKVEQQVATLTGQIEGMNQEKLDLQTSINQMKGELLELRTSESDKDREIRSLQVQNQQLMDLYQKFMPQTQKTAVE